ncbi:STY1053 family phage-associated protein [Burkholderia theae]|uniref:STY1053 family phage-associated protein n=1 Tax=Burkholderia theae TaxID=3143496 RepID=UPI003AFB12CA
MAKTKIYVAKAFKLLRADGIHADFPVGMHTVDQDIADNWYVKHHTGDPGDVLATPGADELAAAVAAARAELDAEGRRLTEQHAELDAMSKGIDARAADLDAREGSIAARELEHASNVAAFEASQAATAEAASQKQSGSQKQGGKQA